MKCFAMLMLAAAMAISIPTAHAGDAIIPPVRVRIICSVPTQWEQQACWVEFGLPVAGQRVEVVTQADAEELVALLLAYGGRGYALDSNPEPTPTPDPPPPGSVPE